MPEVKHTNFVPDQESHEPSIDPSSPYTIIEPVVEVNRAGESTQLNADEVLTEMQTFVDYLVTDRRFHPGITIPFGDSRDHSLGEVIGDHASSFLSELTDHGYAIPTSLNEILTTIANLAERSGFDPDKALFRGSLMYDKEDGSNPNLNIHSDGLSGLAKEDTKSAKTIRFVYSTGPGTLLYPKLDKQGRPVEVTYQGSGIADLENPSDLERLNAPRATSATEEELTNAEAQQVRPGRILAFDPTRTFWHQAPEADDKRAILVVDVVETEEKQLFTPKQSSQEVKEFIAANPELDLTAALTFLVETYPQTDEGRLMWLVDGGAAVKLLASPDRPIGDIDIVTRTDDLRANFANSGQFDAKEIRNWLRTHSLADTEQIAQRVLESGIEVPFDGDKTVWVIRPEILAAIKTLPFESHPQREKDRDDIQQLGVSQTQIHELVNELQTGN